MGNSQIPKDRPPLEEIAKRTAEGAAALDVAWMAVGMRDHDRMLWDHAKRLRDGHRAMAKAAGFEVEEMADDMGDIVVTGDNYFSNGTQAPWQKQQPSPQPTPTTQQPPTSPQVVPAPAQNGTLDTLVKAGILAAATALGAGGTYLATRPTPATPPPAAQDQLDYQLHLLPPDKPAAP